MPKFRKSTLQDIEEMMKIVDAAKALLKSQNIFQWQSGYPNRPLLEQDVKEGIGYVLTEGEQIVGMCAVTFGEDESYQIIEDGKWLTDHKDYAVVHRMAVGEKYHGKNYPAVMFAEIASLAQKAGMKSIRVDTHHQNIAMQRTLKKLNFSVCGNIRLIGGEEDGQPRLALEKLLG